MHGEAKVPFVRHSVQRQGQSFADQTPRLGRLSCKNRGRSIVPQQDRTGGANWCGQPLEGLTLGAGQARHPSRDGTDRPSA